MDQTNPTHRPLIDPTVDEILKPWFVAGEVARYFPDRTPDEARRIAATFRDMSWMEVENFRETLKLEYEARMEINRLYFLEVVGVRDDEISRDPAGL